MSSKSVRRRDDGKFSRQRGRGTNKPKECEVDGEIVKLICLADAAKALGISKKTMRRYEESGTIPCNRYIDDRGRRWYHPRFVKIIAPCFSNQSEKRTPLWRLKAEVERAWQKAQLSGDAPYMREKPVEL